MGRYLKMLGDTRRFAVQIGLDDDPDQGRGATKEESASWGSFQVWADGINLCAHAEQDEMLDAVHWYTLPLLEWFVQQWDCLLHEERLPAAAAGVDGHAAARANEFWLADERDEQRWYDWQVRHSLLTCREGGVFPDLVIRRRRSLVELAWGQSDLPGLPSHLKFLSGDGRALIPPRDVAQPLSEVVLDAVRFLRERCPNSERLDRLEQEARALDSPGAKPRRIALLAGLGERIDQCMDRWNRVEECVRQAAGPRSEIADEVVSPQATELVVTGSCHATLMFGSVSPTVSEQDVVRLAECLVSLYDPKGDPKRLQELVREEPMGPHAEPWRQGYVLAERFRESGGLPQADGGPVDIGGILSGLGIETKELRLEDQTVRAVAIAGPHHRPCVCMNSGHPTNQYPSGRRFTLAHELCHVLYDREYGQSLAMASGPWAPLDVEQRANAFAAMLLMPSTAVRSALPYVAEGALELADAVTVARRLGVSLTALLRHLQNLGTIDDYTREALEEQASSGP